MNTPAIQAIEEIQTILARFFPQIKVDGDIGKITMSCIAELDEMGDQEALNAEPLPASAAKGGKHVVNGTSFADLKDVEAFRQCKRGGGSDQACFKKGDNGIGKWGHNTAQETTPMVALPREVWRNAGKTGGALVRVSLNDKSVLAILGDTMPSLSNIENGAGIDMNPATVKALGLRPPVMQKGIVWEWA